MKHPKKCINNSIMNTIIEKIRAGVERLKKEHQVPTFRGDEYEEGGVNGYQLALDKVLAKLSTLEKEEKPSNPTIQEQPVKTDIIEDLKHYLATTPKEQIEKDWEPLKEWGKVGPSVSEFLGWKQPVSEGLEEEAESCWRIVFPDGGIETTKMALTHDEFIMCARHFAQWGAEHYFKSEFLTKFAEMTGTVDTMPKNTLPPSKECEKGLREPLVSDDLEEAAEEYGKVHTNEVMVSDGYHNDHTKEMFDVTPGEAFIAGAKWQAEQDQETVVGFDIENHTIFLSTNPTGLNKKDTVRIIIVKEEGKCTE